MVDMQKRVVIAHNIRSIHNVGAIFRTCEGFGVDELILTGYTPHPSYSGDPRLPHVSRAMTEKIKKTALGAESLVHWRYATSPPLEELQKDGYTVIGLEQDSRSIPLTSYPAPERFALLLGEEVNGIEQSLRESCEALVEIPMYGQKESFNVSVATGIALYALAVSN